MPPEIRPLSSAKKTRIMAIIRKDPRLGAVLKGRHRPVLIEPNITDRGQPKGVGQAVVGLYDYDRNRSIVALVDMEQGGVLSVEETLTQFQLDEEEQKEAEALAAGDSRVRAFLGNRRMNPLTRLYFPPKTSGKGPSHRYAIVFLRPNNSQRRYAVVDLSERTVVDVIEPSALTAAT